MTPKYPIEDPNLKWNWKQYLVFILVIAVVIGPFIMAGIYGTN